jgi:DnaJ-class molecular chaperone
MTARDPYLVLGVDPAVSDADLRAAYRRLVKQHHPDHNGGSAESERLFEEVQDAYSRVRALRTGSGGAGSGRAGAGSGSRAGSGGHSGQNDVEARIAAMERELREARVARERAERAREEALRVAREAAAASARVGTADGRARPSDEELGYFSTNDSIAKILADARDALADRFDGLADKLKGDRDDR